MNISGLVILLVVASLIGRIVKSVRLNQAKRDKQDPQIPYHENQPQGTAAHESAAKPGVWKGVDSFRQMLERLEVSAAEEQRQKDPSVNFSQAFEEITPVPRPVAPRGEGIVSTEGTVSTQGTYSTQGLVSAEGIVSTQGLGSKEGGRVSQRVTRAKTSAPARGMVSPHEYFSNVAEMRRAVVMSEVLAKPVSLRKKRAI